MRPISSISIYIGATIYTTTCEWVWFSKDKKIKRQFALLLAQKNYGQCQGFIHFGNVDHLLLRITLIRRKLLSVSSSIRSLFLLPFRKWLVVFQRWRSLIHFICPFLSLFCFFFMYLDDIKGTQYTFPEVLSEYGAMWSAFYWDS